jgi:hypothetical protein
MSSGVSLNVMGGMGAGYPPPWASGPVAGSSNTNAAIFGPQPTSSSSGPNGANAVLAALNPLTPFGLTIISGAIAVALLIAIRQTLQP